MKQSTESYTFLLCLVVLFTSVFCRDTTLNTTLNYLTKYHLHIVNELEDGKYLDVHCKSKNSDIGLQHLAPHGGNFVFSFRIDFFATTLFWCNFWHDNFHAAFKVFESSDEFVYGNCGGGPDCIWKVQDNGFYLFNQTAYVFRHPWGPRRA
ncbi:hypothetical protein SLA2020_163370 [Shorea laevis]